MKLAYLLAKAGNSPTPRHAKGWQGQTRLPFNHTNEIAEVQTAIDKAAPAAHAEIAKLDVPWSVTRTGLVVASQSFSDPKVVVMVIVVAIVGLIVLMPLSRALVSR
jgi:hypothetical protein